ncbi:MAG: glutamate-5-semialdehyde dehydrogenase [Alphaproteobacteria bacterium]|nr:glutamate-5-semialdehyde dehydrogenase [Alphaproteobacteria bacterium]
MSHSEPLAAEMCVMGIAARHAARALRDCSADAKSAALHACAAAIRAHGAAILRANADDMAQARHDGLGAALLDRLKLDDGRLEAMAKGVDEVADLPDPVGRELARWSRPNGLEIARIATAIGVIGIVYESRPNVTADAAALCLKSGNAVILRGGSESARSCTAILEALRQGLSQGRLPVDAVQMVPTTDREAVGMMLTGLDGAIDLIIPRGGKGLVGRVQAEARVPVLAHLEGICHVYVHEAADPQKARAIVLNSKMRRTGICAAAETLLVDRRFPKEAARQILEDLIGLNCEIRGDETFHAMFPKAGRPATEEDWRTEYLDAVISVKAVNGLEDAIRHIESYGSHHTESIVTEDPAAAERFLTAVDSAIVMWNASTQFADGGEFGMGAEIGIGTGKLHARGPVGVEQLTTFKYVVCGNGQIRA